MGKVSLHDFPATVKSDTDPFRFGQLVETVKDVFVIETQKFFESWANLSEIPNIEKFHFEDPANLDDLDQLATWVHIIEQYPDIMQRLPLIAVTTAAGAQRKMAFGNQYVGVYWKVPEIRTGTHEPFALTDGMVLNYRTVAGQSSITFEDEYFVNINSLTARELADYINLFSSDLQAVTYETEVDGETVYGIKFLTTTAPASADLIEILDSGDLNTVLGIPIDTIDDATITLPFHRHHYAMNLTVGMDVAAESENNRKELIDLLMVFFQFYMSERDFTFFGAANLSDANGEIVPQPFQIIMGETQSKSGETEVPRPEGDGSQKIYVDRWSIPITVFQFIDRVLSGPDQGVVSRFVDPPWN